MPVPDLDDPDHWTAIIVEKDAEIARLRALAETPDLSADLAATRAEIELLRALLKAVETIIPLGMQDSNIAKLVRAALPGTH